MAATHQTSSRPMGVTVYQPALGSPLQFFPALGSQRLDDLMHALCPGPSTVSEKRAWIALDFFRYARETRQNSRFYPVKSACSSAILPSAASPSVDLATSSSVDLATSSCSSAIFPLAASPSVDLATSSHHVSPPTPSWDWRATWAPSLASSSSSGTPPQRRRQSRTRGPTSKYRNVDLSHLPGMKILTKDGVDVTNVASRGSKSKEQRDHAHLMRIIKACDSCRRKKIRCDTSHRRRGAAHGAPQSTTRPTKKPRTVPAEAPPSFLPPITRTNTDMLFHGDPWFGFDSDLFSNCTEDLSSAASNFDLLEYVQLPAPDTPEMDLAFGSNDYAFTQSSHSSLPVSWQKAVAPSCQVDPGAPLESGFLDSNPQDNFFFNHDFLLYSPRSEFSEDERMLVVGSTNRGQQSLAETVPSECLLPPSIIGSNGETTGRNDFVPSFHVPQVDRGGDWNDIISGVGGRDQLATMDAPMGPDGWTSVFDLRAARLSEPTVWTDTLYSTDNFSIARRDTFPGDFAQRDISTGHEPSALTTDVLVTMPGVAEPGIVRASTSAESRNVVLAGCRQHVGPATADGRGNTSAFSAMSNAVSSGTQRLRGIPDPGAGFTWQSAPAMADDAYMVQQNHAGANPQSPHPEALITSSQSADAGTRRALQAMSANRTSSDLPSDRPLSSSADGNCSTGVGRPRHAGQQRLQQATRHTPDAAPRSLEIDEARNVRFPNDVSVDKDAETSCSAAARVAGPNLDVPGGSLGYTAGAFTEAIETTTRPSQLPCNRTKQIAGVALANQCSTPTTAPAHTVMTLCALVSLDNILCLLWRLAVSVLGDTMSALISEVTADMKSTSMRPRQSLRDQRAENCLFSAVASAICSR